MTVGLLHIGPQVVTHESTHSVPTTETEGVFDIPIPEGEVLLSVLVTARSLVNVPWGARPTVDGEGDPVVRVRVQGDVDEVQVTVNLVCARGVSLP